MLFNAGWLTNGHRTVLRLFYTVRYLKPVQVYGRLWFRLYRPRPDLRPAPGIRSVQRQPVEWCARQSSMSGPEQFCFLNEEGSLDHGWDDPQHSKLWRYNLHYFDDLNSAEWQERIAWHQALIERWISDNSPGEGSGWEPYPLSLRIVNWIKWNLAGNPLERSWQDSLAVQVRYLARRLEHHLLGNHLFVNAKALVFAGLFFHGPEADRWLAKGFAIIAREMKEQILADGGHFERSPMYHALILEDVLDLVNISRCYGGDAIIAVVHQWEPLVERMRFWLSAMTHPNGEVSFFNDAACGIAPSLDSLAAYARRLGFGPVAVSDRQVTRLAESGYIRVADHMMVALLDVAPVGPQYLPGHAHADTLSFELSLWGQRIFVNSGISQYGKDAERQRQRSTPAHNTVVVDGQNSSVVWAGFRVAQRAHPIALAIERTAEKLVISAAHDGYERLPGKVVHRRCWDFTAKSLSLLDQVTGQFNLAEARFHLHPDMHVDTLANKHYQISLATGRAITVHFVGADKVRLERTTWHPAFGVSIPNNCLVAQFTSAELVTQILWS